jgi:hypothetical protein
VTVSSERLTADLGWEEVPAGRIIVLRRDRAPQFVDALSGRPVHETRTRPDTSVA